MSPTSSTASSSSPNPESSPFKLLERPQMNEDLEQLRKQEISEAIKDEKVNEEPIEKLNEEKSSTQPQIVDNHEPKSVEVESQSKAEPQVELLQASENMKVIITELFRRLIRRYIMIYIKSRFPHHRKSSAWIST